MKKTEKRIEKQATKLSAMGKSVQEIDGIIMLLKMGSLSREERTVLLPRVAARAFPNGADVKKLIAAAKTYREALASVKHLNYNSRPSFLANPVFLAQSTRDQIANDFCAAVELLKQAAVEDDLDEPIVTPLTPAAEYRCPKHGQAWVLDCQLCLLRRWPSPQTIKPLPKVEHAFIKDVRGGATHDPERCDACKLALLPRLAAELLRISDEELRATPRIILERLRIIAARLDSKP